MSQIDRTGQPPMDRDRMLDSVARMAIQVMDRPAGSRDDFNLEGVLYLNDGAEGVQVERIMPEGEAPSYFVIDYEGGLTVSDGVNVTNGQPTDAELWEAMDLLILAAGASLASDCGIERTYADSVIERHYEASNPGGATDEPGGGTGGLGLTTFASDGDGLREADQA